MQSTECENKRGRKGTQQKEITAFSPVFSLLYRHTVQGAAWDEKDDMFVPGSGFSRCPLALHCFKQVCLRHQMSHFGLSTTESPDPVPEHGLRTCCPAVNSLTNTTSNQGSRQAGH